MDDLIVKYCHYCSVRQIPEEQQNMNSSDKIENTYHESFPKNKNRDIMINTIQWFYDYDFEMNE